MDIEKLKSTFKTHVDKYDNRIEGIKLKYFHSLRVMELARNIGKDIDLSDSDMNTVTIIGLLHDYGRFAQLEEYQTYDDSISMDHADAGVELLFNQGQIVNYTKNKNKYDEIRYAIGYHNKYEVPNNLSEHEKEMCKIIRDADKLDILYLVSINDIPNVVKGEISEDVKKNFNAKEQVLKDNVKTRSDEIIVRLSLVYDINYKYALLFLKEKGYINKMFDLIDDKEKFQYYFDKTNEYIDKRLGEYDVR